MRISDWSSDVCSSDLGRLRTNAADRVLHSPACSRNQGYSRGPDERTPLRSNTTWRPDPWAEQSYFPRPGENRAGIDRPALPAHRRSIPRTDCLCLPVRRSEERPVGKDCVSTCSSWWSPYPLTQNNIIIYTNLPISIPPY